MTFNADKVTRLGTVWITMAMTISALRWSMDFAMLSDKGAIEVAAIIGAIMGPLSLLQGAVFNFNLRHPVDVPHNQSSSK